MYDDGRADPLYELEAARASLEEARRRGAPEELLRGLEDEIAWWRARAEKACVEDAEEE